MISDDKKIIIDQNLMSDKINLKYKLIGQQEMSYLCSKDTNHIKVMHMNNNHINYLGIKQMRKTQWRNLIQINFWQNQIGDKGCRQLSKIAFPVLNQIRLSSNKISTIGTNYLRKSVWPMLSLLYFCIDLYYEAQSYISHDGIRYLLQGHWKEIGQLGFSNILFYEDGNKLKVEQILKIILMRYNSFYGLIVCQVSGIDNISQAYLRCKVTARFPKIESSF